MATLTQVDKLTVLVHVDAGQVVGAPAVVVHDDLHGGDGAGEVRVGGQPAVPRVGLVEGQRDLLPLPPGEDPLAVAVDGRHDQVALGGELVKLRKNAELDLRKKKLLKFDFLGSIKVDLDKISSKIYD